MAEQQQNPNLISRKAMSAMSNTSGARGETVHEIFTKINNAKDKPKKIEVLKRYDTPFIRQLLKAAFDPKIKWILPEGTPPYIANEAPEGTEHTLLRNETRKLYLFIEGGNPNLKPLRREQIFVNMLEELDPDDAELVLACKARKIKGISKKVVQEAYPGFLADDANK